MKGTLLRLARVWFNYKLGKTELPYGPVRLWVEPTNKCNLRCPMCVQKGYDEETGFMNMELFKKVMEDAAELGVRELLLLDRGEPFLHPELVDMVSMSTDAGIRTTIHTNGTVMTPNLARGLVQAGTDMISFSFDAYGKELYEEMRPGASYQRVVDNIKTLVRTRDLMESKTPYIMIESILFPQYEKILSSQKELELRLSDLGADKYLVRELGEWVDTKSLKKKKKVEDARPLKPCRLPWYSLVVYWDGTAVLCCQDWYGRNVVGDIKNESLAEIWNGSRMKKVRADFTARNYFSYPLCQRCYSPRLGLEGGFRNTIRFLFREI